MLSYKIYNLLPWSKGDNPPDFVSILWCTLINSPDGLSISRSKISVFGPWLESSRWDDPSQWSSVEIGWEITEIVWILVEFTQLIWSSALIGLKCLIKYSDSCMLFIKVSVFSISKYKISVFGPWMESSRWDDPGQWSSVKIGWEITEILWIWVQFTQLIWSSALISFCVLAVAILFLKTVFLQS